MAHRKNVPSYRPGSEPSEERVDYLVNELVDKVLERRSNLKLGLKELFRKHDTSNSGSLEFQECIQALQNFLPGFDAMEYQAIVRHLDIDNSGTLEINEVAQLLHDLHHGDNLPPPPEVPADWGKQTFDSVPPLPKYFDSVSKGGPTNKDAKGKKHSRYGSTGGRAFTAAEDDTGKDKDSVVGSDFSFHESIRKSFWKGDIVERHYRFLHKLRESLHEKLKHKYAEMTGTDRLFEDKDVLMDRFCRKELTRLFEHGANSTNNDVVVDRDNDRIRRVKFEKFRAVLKGFRTPGQPFLTWNDIRELHSLCDDGDIKTFFEVLFAKSNQEFVSSNKDAEARIRATREIPGLDYPATKTTVYPPAGWHEQKKKLYSKSATVPTMALELEYVHGYDCRANGRNLYSYYDKNTSATKLVFSTAAIVIIHDPATKTQKYFMDHSDDVVAICIDSTGTLCASGQPTSIDDDGRSRPPIVYIWDLATLAVLRTIDVKVLAKVNIQRSITGLSFSNDSSKLFIIGADDKHTVSMFDITESPAQILEDSPGQLGPPPQIHSIESAPKLVANAFCCQSLFVSVGQSSHIKFWTWKPKDVERLGFLKGKFLKVTPPRLLMSICFMPKDDVVYVGSGDGRILVFRFPGECFTAQLVHQNDSVVKSMCAQKDGKHIWSGGSDHMLYQCSIKDYKLTKLRSYDFSSEGAGRMEIIMPPKDGDNFSHHAGSTRSDTFVKSNNSHRSKGNVLSVAQQSVEKIKRTNNQVQTTNLQDMRKKQPTDPVVCVRDLVLVAQNNDKIEEEIGLVAATDSGSFWYIDWMRDNVEEIYYCHAASPFTGPGGVQGISPHPSRNAIFATCGEDRMISVWDASTRERMRVGKLQEAANCIAWSPQEGQHLAVGFVGGYVGIYDSTTFVRIAWHRRGNGDVNVVKYSPNGRQLAAGTHDNVIDLFDVKHKESPYHHRKRMIGHSSSVVNLDWSADSKLIQSTCGAYEILYWDAIKGKNLRATKDSTESDTVWETWSLAFGFPVMGIWQRGWGKTDVNAVSRSRDMKLLVFGDDFGKVNFVNAPCIVKHAPRRVYSGHSAHVDDVTFLLDDQRVVSCGGRDMTLLQYRVVNSGDMDPGTNLLLQEGTSGTLKTTKFGGGFSSNTLDKLGVSSSQSARRGAADDDSDISVGGGGRGGVRWGEDILLPPKGIVKPAWTRERFNDSNDIFDVEASLRHTSSRGGKSSKHKKSGGASGERSER